MNLIGKIFVVIIFLMGGLFMVLAMAVYSSQVNWRDAYKKSQELYTQRDTEYKRLVSSTDLTEAELNRQILAANKEIGALQSERERLVGDYELLQKQVSDLTQENRDAKAAVSSTQANAERLADENNVLQREIIAAQEASDKAFEQTVRATSELHDKEVKLVVAEENIEQLTERVAEMTIIMRREGLDPHMLVGDTIPTVQGYISTVSRRGGDETIEITIGSDDGIKPEHTVEIYRTASDPGQSKWLGRAVVLSTDGDKAYARVLPKLKKGQIQRGDRVATRLN
ncbi:hypothetical protein [Aeoliella sp.]|uniref:hypothetical protein n=1 Tax=Aeoliella sp. TaxID=2795800 RepID=UPI003CCBFDFE